MDLKKTILSISLICSLVSGVTSLDVTYTGETLFEVGKEAVLVCSIQPTPEDVESLEVKWALVGSDGASSNIGKVKVNETTLYHQTGPSQLLNRFTMFYERFAGGKAIAAITNLTISDESTYLCDAEVTVGSAPAQASRSFSISAYKLPTIEIEIVTPEFNLNMPVTNEVENQEENVGDLSPNSSESEEEVVSPEDAPSEVVSPKDAPSEVVPSEEAPSEVVPPSRIEVAKCNIAGVYPQPHVVEFTSSRNQKWEFNEESYEDVVENEDGSFDLIVRLEVEPSSDLDGASFQCRTKLVPGRDITTHSPRSTAIAVLYQTTYVDISRRPHRAVNRGGKVTIGCNSNGNPPPEKTLHLPGGSTIDVSDGPYKFRANKESSGTYYCSASNLEGEVVQSDETEVEVLYIEKPTISGPSVVSGGDVAILKCTLTSASGGWLTRWFKVGSEDVLSTSTTLDLSPASPDKAGNYTCQVSGAGEVKLAFHVVQVEVGCVPQISFDVSSSKQGGGAAYVDVTCVAKGNPPCKMVLEPYKEYVPHSKGNIATLAIEHLPKQMEPLPITCSASNPISSNTITKELNHESTCCFSPTAGGMSAGVTALIIIILVFVIIGAPLAYFLLRPSSRTKTKKRSTQPDDPEMDGLNVPLEDVRS